MEIRNDINKPIYKAYVKFFAINKIILYFIIHYFRYFIGNMSVVSVEEVLNYVN